MIEQLALLPEFLPGHLQLTLVALSIGFAVSVPLGVWVTRSRRLEPAILGVASVVQTIPSLALLALMVPALAVLSGFTAQSLGVEIRSIGYLPAVIGLTLYSVLPMLRNTVTGIQGIDASVIEAARAAGMTERQQLFRVELPLALPVIVAGLRTAAVWVVGTATLSTPVGAPSLGNYIFSGLQTRNFSAVTVGCVSAALLALLLDFLVRWLEIGLKERRRASIAGAGAVMLGLYLYTGLTFATELAAGGAGVVRIGAKTFSEQYILSEMIALQIERETGRATRTVQSLGSTVAFDALRSGEIDVYVDYSGTIWATIMHRETLPANRTDVVDQVGAYLRREHDITLVGSLGFENTYALGMRRDRARELGLERISQLTPFAPGFEIGGDYEFFSRPEWPALVESYGFTFRKQRSMDSSLMYQAVHESQVDVISAFSTDGRIAAFDLVLLEDDHGVIPPYDAIILAGPRVEPEILEALASLVGRIDAAEMQRMNLSVDEEGLSPRTVAERFLERLAGSEVGS